MSRRTIALGLLRRAERAADDPVRPSFDAEGYIPRWKQTHESRRAYIESWIDAHFDDHVDILLALEDRIAEKEEAHKEKTMKWYFVTLAPAHDSNPLHLINWAKRFADRSPVAEVLWSIEQKGSTPETLGHHPHVHMAIKRKTDTTAWRSKGEVLRDALSTAKACGLTVADNCCDVKSNVADGRNMFMKYCVAYESADEHKAATMACDATWREQLRVEPYYDSHPPSDVVP